MIEVPGDSVFSDPSLMEALRNRARSLRNDVARLLSEGEPLWNAQPFRTLELCPLDNDSRVVNDECMFPMLDSARNTQIRMGNRSLQPCICSGGILQNSRGFTGVNPAHPPPKI